MKQVLLMLFIIAISITSSAQTRPYYIEIPDGFSQRTPKGKNVDLLYGDVYGASISVVKTNIPKEYLHYSIWDMLGDLDSYVIESESGLREYLDYPKIVKYGKTQIDGIDAFWYDQTVGRPAEMYTKIYQVKVGSWLYTISLGSPYLRRDSYTALWFRLKNGIRFVKQ
jgi:hypothetical protein